MKDLNNIKKFKRMLLLSLFLFPLYSGCTKEKTSELAVRDDFIGVWQCEEFDANNQLMATFQVEIIPDPVQEKDIHIDNFNLLGSGFSVQAETNKGQLTIYSQSIAGNSYSGTGTIDNDFNSIEMQYLVQDISGTSENLRAYFTKL